MYKVLPSACPIPPPQIATINIFRGYSFFLYNPYRHLCTFIYFLLIKNELMRIPQAARYLN